MPTIIFKATEACNANCIYCDVVQRKAPRIMPLDLLEVCFKSFNRYLEENPRETINLTWHGGEPCIVGADYFKEAVEFQENHCRATKARLHHSIQSNLTLINQDIIDVLRRLGIGTIGTSFEVLPNIRGVGKRRNSETYNRLFMKGAELLRKNKISWGFIYVVTRQALTRPLDIFNFLANFKLNGNFKIHPVEIFENDDKNKIGITPLEFTEFLGAIFPAWWEHRSRFKEVDPFRTYLKNYEEGPRHLSCSNSGQCAFDHVYIGPTGRASHCGRSSDWEVLSYGNIKDRSLTDIFQDRQRRVLMERDDVLQETECRGCGYWRICHGGCPLDAYNDRKDFMHKTEWCDAKRIFLKKYFEPITGLKADFSVHANA
ncbi:MAG: radical SAM protein [Elusimicrobia bacterium]|nr:radical SAM protein [Elusimicrobiota bacterium]